MQRTTPENGYWIREKLRRNASAVCCGSLPARRASRQALEDHLAVKVGECDIVACVNGDADAVREPELASLVEAQGQPSHITSRDLFAGELHPIRMSDVRKGKPSAQPILDGEQLAGMVTDRDIVIRAVAKGKDPRGMPVSEIASRELVTVHADDDLAEALRLMELSRCGDFLLSTTTTGSLAYWHRRISPLRRK